MRRRDYPGWHMVWALGFTETISYGVLFYSFAAFLLPMQQSLGFSQNTLTGAFSLSLLVAGAGALPAGAWLDCCGARGLMSAGSLLPAGSAALLFIAGDRAHRGQQGARPAPMARRPRRNARGTGRRAQGKTRRARDPCGCIPGGQLDEPSDYSAVRLQLAGSV